MGNGNETSAEGSISGPIVQDKLFVRLAAGITDRDGYFDNVILHEKVDPLHDKKFQGLLKYTPNDKLTVDLHVNLAQTKAGALNLWYQPANLNPDYTLNTSDPFNYNHENANDVRTYFYANNIGKSERDIDNVSVRAAYDLGFATLSSITAYTHVVRTVHLGPVSLHRQPRRQRRLHRRRGAVPVRRLRRDQPGGPPHLPGQPAAALDGRRLCGRDRPLHLDHDQRDLGYGIIGLKQTPAFTDPRNPTLSFLADNNHDRAWAVFGNVEYDLTKKLEIGFALRYDDDNRKQFVSPYNTAGSQGDVNTADFNRLQPKATLRYALTPDVRVSAS